MDKTMLGLEYIKHSLNDVFSPHQKFIDPGHGTVVPVLANTGDQMQAPDP